MERQLQPPSIWLGGCTAYEGGCNLPHMRWGGKWLGWDLCIFLWCLYKTSRYKVKDYLVLVECREKERECILFILILERNLYFYLLLEDIFLNQLRVSQCYILVSLLQLVLIFDFIILARYKLPTSNYRFVPFFLILVTLNPKII